MNANASAQDGVEPITVASARLDHAVSSIPRIPVPSLFSNMALGYQTDREASLWASCACYVGLAFTVTPEVTLQAC